MISHNDDGPGTNWAGLLVIWLSIDSMVAAAEPTAIKPLASAHAHNDYQHPRPLFDALAQGFCSVEADVHLVNGDLWVAHDANQLRADRTLETLYLRPLWDQVRQHDGHVYADRATFTLLIDFKTAAEPTYTALLPLLRKYAPMLQRWTDGQLRPGAVQVVISGNRPIDTIAKSTDRLAFIDGRLSDLDDGASQAWMPLISDQWTSHFRWNGTGPIDAQEYDKLTALVTRAHQQHCRIRFWAIPDHPAAWQVLSQAGVDLINTDRLAALAEFLKAHAANGDALPPD